MRFLIITNVLHKPKNGKWFAYAPYVQEMILWLNHVDEVEIIAPITSKTISDIDIAYKHDTIVFNQIPSIAFIGFVKSIVSLLVLPNIIFKLFGACRRADHIHLRCPGNIGLLGCLVQIFFPKKIKTAKYAGNWDPKAKQPLSYRFQKKILANTLLTKNIEVLVYGKWRNQSKHVKPFFTATYSNSEIEAFAEKDYSKKINFVFVGSLVEGKNPLLAIKIVEGLNEQGESVILDMYGDGVLKNKLQQYIEKHQLKNIVNLHGNQTRNVIKKALRKAHFLILPSISEGWPKAVAEAMFFGVVPIATKVSCIPYMLDYGKRGILITLDEKQAIQDILSHFNSNTKLKVMSKLALDWSQQFTLDHFETEIRKLLEND